jgi:beta-lactamase regulating signal transducer with metallopeptidase domain
MNLASIQSLAELAAGRMLNCLAEGIGIALFAWILLRITRKNSGTRFAVWFLALLTVAALPVFGSLWPDRSHVASHSGITIPGSWASYLFAAWGILSAVGLARVSVGLWQLHRLRKSCVPVDPEELDPVVRATFEQFNSRRPIALCLSHQVRVPTAIGFSKPLVVIPSWVFEKLSPTELNTILLHELAHLRRWDDWTNLAQRILGALLFFHPAVWWIQKRLSLEREMACDDLVLAEAANPRTYAECLVALAENNYFRRGTALAQAAVSQLRHISLRLAQILDKDRPRATRVWKPALAFLSGFTVISLALSPYTPKLVSFADDSGTLASSAPSVSNPIRYRSAEETRISSQGTHVIRAKLAIRSGSNNSRPAARNTNSELKSARIAATTPERQVKHPALLEARAGNPARLPRSLLLVVETEEYRASGSAGWNLCVWRVVVVNPQQISNQKAAAAKAI